MCRDAVITTIIASLLAFPGCSCILRCVKELIAALWKFLNLAQELVLLSVINTKFVSQTLIQIFQGCSFLNFNMFSALLSMLPPDMQGESGYNVLPDNSQYHPYIFLMRLVYHGMRSFPITTHRCPERCSW